MISALIDGTVLAQESGGSSSSSASEFGPVEMLMIAAVVLCIVLAAFFAMSETALTRVSRIKANSLAEDGRKGAGPLKRLADRPEIFITPLLLLVLLCHLIISTLLTLLVEGPFGFIGVVVALALELVFIFVLSEAGPKTWALQHTERAALIAAPPVSFVVSLPPLKVLTRGLIWLTNLVIPGKGLPHGPATSEQELLAMADAAHEDDVIEKGEREIIHSVIEFGDTVTREVMVPRPDMVTVAATATIDEAMDLAIKHGFSRIPASRESKDDIAGIVYVKDLMRASRDGRAGESVGSIVRPARFAPEGKRVAELMREMQALKYHMAIVLDEYGGTAGLVTLEDLIEELVGEIVDEYDVEEPQLERLPNGDVRVTSRMLIDEINDLLDVEWPSEDWDSVGGLVFNLLGHPAAEGETVEYHGHRLRAERVKGRRIGRVRITRIPDPEDAGREALLHEA